MTKIKSYAFTTLVILCFSMLHAQSEMPVNHDNLLDAEEIIGFNDKSSIVVQNVETETDYKHSISAESVETVIELHYSGRWIIGAGINVIEDSGKQNFSNFTESKYNHFGSPFMLSAEYLTKSKFSFSATILLNKYQSGKEIQGLTIQDNNEPNYFAIDLATKMFFRKIQTKYKFTPYVTAGAGYRHISGYQAVNKIDHLVEVPKTRDLTINAGIGANYWINKTWGLNLNYIGKFAMKAGANKDYKTNHLVLSFGVFYRFNNKKFD